MCDLFGHVSQLPQIMRGFGIATGFVWRGINNESRSNLLWEGADGSELACYKFTRDGYSDYAFAVREAGMPFVQKRDGAPMPEFEAERCARQLEEYLRYEAANSDISSLLLFDGGDHQNWDQPVYEVLRKRIEAGGKDFRVVHSSLDAFAAELERERAKIKTRFKGELREPSRTTRVSAHIIHGVLSSRVWIKQANAECQTLLCQWAEPFAAFAATSLGLEWPAGYLDVAWRWVLQNHPHDSICGCSIDQVHEDMKYRFSQARQIGERLTREATTKLAASIEGDIPAGDARLVVFNPATAPFDGIAEIDVALPKDGPKFGEFFWFEDMPVFRLFDAGGREVVYQRLGQTMDHSVLRLRANKFPEHLRVNRVRVSLPLSVPALGYTTLTVVPAEDRRPCRHPEVPGLATGATSMENEALAVWVHGNGTLTMLDKRTGQTYEDLMTFEDRADIGDGWFHGPAANDQTWVSTGSPAAIALVENGPNVAAFRIRQKMSVPAAFDFKAMRRTEEHTELTIETTVRLRRGADHVELEVAIDNSARDHRLRVLFPSGARAKSYLADSAFDVVERAIALREDNHLYNELEVETKPQHSWTAVFDKQRGLAVLSTGLLETAVRDLPERPLALTLFRSTRRTVGTDGEPNGQILGPMRFRAWLRPLAGAPDRGEMFALAQHLAAGLRTVQLDREDQRIHATGKALPAEAGFLSVSGVGVLTSARLVGEGLEVRLFNPTEKAGKARIEWAQRPRGSRTWRKAELVDLDSRPLKAARPELGKSGLAVALKPKQIVTVRLS
ncbi:MAG: glycoside hydrolase family 38 [Candidatus Sumerlaeia bacterium]|nr:glycoside hydrolase family 38 [Candidatus Sumerlaeia bacterium]